MRYNRRSFLLASAAVGAMGVQGVYQPAWAKRGRSRDGGRSKSGLLFGYVPFTQPLFIPEVLVTSPPLDPAPGATPPRHPQRPRDRVAGQDNCAAVAHGIAPEFGNPPPGHTWDTPTEYSLITEETAQQFVPGGPDTTVFTYRDGTKDPGTGRTPGPTVVADFETPVVLRNCNLLLEDRVESQHDHETSIHLHGTHAPAHADGYPNFYVLAGEARDYFYPNIAPRRNDPGSNPEDVDTTWIPSTLWYHDHAMDVTGFNVSRGLAGFYLVFDEREKQLIEDQVLPDSFGTDEMHGPLDIGLALTDQQIDGNGQIIYDFLDHNGRIGDVFTVNGVVQPFHPVQRRKYRFRILNASNARHYQLRLSSRQPFIVIGADSWLFPVAGEVWDFELSPGQRHDVVIDFADSPGEVFLENILIQDDGRGGDDIDPDQPTPLLKFVVMPGHVPNDVTVADGTVIRGFADTLYDFGFGQWAPIDPNEIVKTRRFEWERSHGAWVVNGRFFNPRRADAAPDLGVGAERWIHENGGGGWWHPIHHHLEGFQIQRVDGRPPPFERSFNSDLVNLHGGVEAEVITKFWTFTGPFAFHCHAVEHEDMRMMGTHDPQPGGNSPLDGETRIDPSISGVVPTCEQLEDDRRIFFDAEGDVDRLDGRGVGIPCSDFDGDG